MKVEVLFFPGCPQARPTLDRVRRVLEEEGISVAVDFIRVHSMDQARSLEFPGSPTVRIDGEDIEPRDRSGDIAGGLQCRVYGDETGRREGVPSARLIRNAIRQRKRTVS